MNKVILVIEDSVEVRENMKEILELSNYTVHTAVNGLQGLELARKLIPDIILCDVMMPELDGYGVLRGLTNNPKTKNIPFIFVTARAEKNDFRNGMDLGADDYLTKPFLGSDLLSMVSTRLKKIEHLKEAFGRVEDSSGADVSFSNIYEISDKITAKKLRKKDVLFLEGDASKYLYFIVSGKIKAFRTNEQGKEYITQVYKERNFFGYAPMFQSNTHPDSAVALEDSEVACIAKQDFYQLLSANNSLFRNFIEFVTAELSESNEKLIGLAYNSARKRVSEAILFLAKKYFENLVNDLSFPVCRDDISAISGVSPESVSRNLTDLKSEKLIELQHGQIKITDLKKLQSLKN